MKALDSQLSNQEEEGLNLTEFRNNPPTPPFFTPLPLWLDDIIPAPSQKNKVSKTLKKREKTTTKERKVKRSTKRKLFAFHFEIKTAVLNTQVLEHVSSL